MVTSDNLKIQYFSSLKSLYATPLIYGDTNVRIYKRVMGVLCNQALIQNVLSTALQHSRGFVEKTRPYVTCNIFLSIHSIFYFSGKSGSKTFVARRFLPRGGKQKEGVTVKAVNSTYFWTQLKHTDFSLGAVVPVARQIQELYTLHPGGKTNCKVIASLSKQPTFCEVATWALAKRRLGNECRNSILMTFTTQI